MKEETAVEVEYEWPSLDGGSLATGTYFAAYARKFHKVDLDGKEFENLHSAIFGLNGAIRLLNGMLARRPSLGDAELVVIYRPDPNGRNVAVVIEPAKDGKHEMHLAPRSFARPNELEQEVRPASTLRMRMLDAADTVTLDPEDASSYPSGH